jgi:hypothetical protein
LLANLGAESALNRGQSDERIPPMKRLLIAGATLTLLAVPATATAEPTGEDRSNAAQECRDLRGGTDATREAFRVQFGTNPNGRNAFGKCVSRRSQSEERQRESARTNAAQDCRAERSVDRDAFAKEHGTNANKRNAFGKCVSEQARENKAEADERDAERIATRKAAARDCAAERSVDRDAFAKEHGTNANKRNAFGKCVSEGARS